MSINFKAVLEEKKALVWPIIDHYLNTLAKLPPYCKIPQKYQSLLDFHLKMLRDYPERQGKYLRPSLVLLTAQAMGFDQNKALKTATAMQLSEEWILGHDDVEDDSEQRRGKPALHKIYGKELAFNAGDGQHVLMWKILADNVDAIGIDKSRAIQNEFYQMLNRTVLGQTIELKWTQENKLDLTDDDILLVLESKTGYYTIAGPMRLGAILSGATEEQLDLIYNFGKKLGQCFQIVDDLLDLTSDFQGQKKQQGNDIYEGKRTIILGHLLRTASEQDRDGVIAILRKTRYEKTPQDIQTIMKLIIKHGSIDYAKKLAEKLASEAKYLFEKNLGFLSVQPARDQLIAGIDFILNRKH